MDQKTKRPVKVKSSTIKIKLIYKLLNGTFCEVVLRTTWSSSWWVVSSISLFGGDLTRLNNSIKNETTTKRKAIKPTMTKVPKKPGSQNKKNE